jgi:antitoxin FitA
MDAEEVSYHVLSNCSGQTAGWWIAGWFPGCYAAECSPLDMRRTCLYAENMSKMIQVRDVPEQVHSILKARAAREGMSLSDFIKKELERSTERPTMREWLESTRRAKPIPTRRSAAQIVRELRDAR